MHTHTHMYIRVNVQFELISTNFELLDISKSLIKNNIHIILYIKHTKKISFFIGTLLTNLDIRNWITALKIKKIIKNQ